MARYYDFECGTCGKIFPAGWTARENHCRATGHSAPRFECERCPRFFNSQQACHQHMDGTNHWPFDCACPGCDETWPTQEQCTEHEKWDHYYCAECDRFFQNYNNIKMHSNSSIHRGKQIDCPFCRKSFTSATGVTHHLETGSCPEARGLNRDQIYRFVRSKDPSGLIAKNLIEWVGSVGYEANERSWNGYAYECYLCHRQFNQLSGLNQHLKSPTHQQALYHCPNRACRRDFKSLAGIINHLENESCGCTRFEQVQRKIGDFFGGDRLITF